MEPRARQGVYLGSSKYHELNVALILNTDNYYIIPQYHVFYDPFFKSINIKEKKLSKYEWGNNF